MPTRDHHGDVISMWKTASSQNYRYFSKVEDEPNTLVFWAEDTPFRRLFAKLDLARVLEIACGHGRHAARVPQVYESLILLDTSVDAVAYASRRFQDNPRIKVVLSTDGVTLPVGDESLTAVYCYDAMVHFEPLTMHGYLREIHRALEPGGRALLHHSAYAENPEGHFTSSPNWRNYMPVGLFRHFCSRAGLRILDQTLMKWGNVENCDALSLVEKPLA